MDKTRLDEATKALDVAINHKMDDGQQIVNVLASRLHHLKQEGKTNG